MNRVLCSELNTTEMTKLRAAYRIHCGKLWVSSCLDELLIAIDHFLRVRQRVPEFLELSSNVTINNRDSSSRSGDRD
jgi:hypothetical protein